MLSLYDIAVPVMISGLGNMAEWLNRGRAYADEKEIPHSQFLYARLADDMMSLIQQVQRASDTAKWAAVRVGRINNLPQPDNETTFEELQARISATVTFLTAVPPFAFDQYENAELVVAFPKGPRTFTARIYWSSRFLTSSSTSPRRTISSDTWVCLSGSAIFLVGVETGPAALGAMVLRA